MLLKRPQRPVRPDAATNLVGSRFGAVAIIGPSTVGKTTLVDQIAAGSGRSIFRLREFARRRAECDIHLARSIASTTDPLGWFDDEIATGLFDLIPLDEHSLPGSLLLLENFPGNARQTAHVQQRCRAAGVPLAAVELTAPPEVLLHRSVHRLVCRHCEPDPHRPASVRAGTTDRCAECGGRLCRRSSDAPSTFHTRLARFSENIGGIRREFNAGGTPLHQIDAGTNISRTRESVLRVIEGVPAASQQ